MKNQVKGRKKREIGEALEPVYQTGPLDYEELLQSLSNDDYLQNPAEKRYLGELNWICWWILLIDDKKSSQVITYKIYVYKKFISKVPWTSELWNWDPY